MARKNTAEVVIIGRDEVSDTLESIQKNVSAFAALQAFQIVAGSLGKLVDGFQFVGEAMLGATDAAIQQEESDRSLALAIGAAGESAEEWLPVLKASADSLQTLTGVGDETTQALSTLLLNFGVAVEKIPAGTEAVLDFAEAAQIGATEAARRLGRTLAGSVEDVAKFAPEVLNLTKAQLANGEAIDILGAKFKGFSSEARSTGSLVRGAEGAFGDLREEFGQSVIESEAVRSAIVAVTEFLVELQGQVDGMQLGQILVTWAAAAVDFAEAFFAVAEVSAQVSEEILGVGAAIFEVIPGMGRAAEGLELAALGSGKFAEKAGPLRESLRRLSEGLDEAAKNSDTFSVAAGRTADEDAKAAAAAARHAAARKALAEATEKANATLFGELRKFRVAAIDDEEEQIKELALIRAEEIGQIEGDAGLRAQVLEAIFEDRDRQLAELNEKALEEERKADEEFEKLADEANDKLRDQIADELRARREKEDAIRGFENQLALIGLEGAAAVLAQEEQRLAELEVVLRREPELREVIEAEKRLIVEESRQALRELEKSQLDELDATLDELGGLATQAGADVIRSIIEGAKGEKDQEEVFQDIVLGIFQAGLSAALLALPGGAALSPLVSGLFGAFHTGGMIPTGHTGLFSGADMFVRAQEGEMLLSRERVNQIGGPGIAQGVGAGTVAAGGGTNVFQFETPSPASFARELRHGEMKRQIERAEKRGDLRRSR